MTSSSLARALAAFVVAAGAFVAREARAQPPAPELMARLAVNAANFERMRTHSSYALAGRMEDVDSDGAPSSRKEMVGHMVPGTEADEPAFAIDRYLEDGEDKTDEARERAADRARDRKRDPSKKKKDIRMPTLAAEQPRYVFDIVEVDPAHPSRVKLSFVPKENDERTIEGTAWIDAERAVVLSAGFKLTRTSMFVKYVHVKVVFGADTPLGPAVSKIEFEGEGGFLFVRKHFRGTATFSQYRLQP